MVATHRPINILTLDLTLTLALSPSPCPSPAPSPSSSSPSLARVRSPLRKAVERYHELLPFFRTISPQLAAVIGCTRSVASGAIVAWATMVCILPLPIPIPCSDPSPFPHRHAPTHLDTLPHLVPPHTEQAGHNQLAELFWPQCEDQLLMALLGACISRHAASKINRAEAREAMLAQAKAMELWFVGTIEYIQPELAHKILAKPVRGTHSEASALLPLDPV